MIQFLDQKEIDKRKWDSCIGRAVNGIVYAYSWYLDIVCPGWCALVEDDYLSVMPLTCARKYGFSYIFPPPFTQQLGLFTTGGMSAEKLKQFINSMPRHFRYIEMNLNTMNHYNPPDFKTRTLVTHLLDLITPYEQTSANYSTQIKRNLRKAMQHSLIVQKGAKPEDVIHLFREHRGREFAHTASYYKILDDLMKVCISRDMGQTWGVCTADNELCAGAFFVGSNKRVVFLFSGANDNAYKFNAMTLLLDNFIKHNSQKELTLDFEGSLNPDIARFYKGFGSKEVTFAQLRRNTLPLPMKWVKELQFRKRAGDHGGNIISTFDKEMGD